MKSALRVGCGDMVEASKSRVISRAKPSQALSAAMHAQMTNTSFVGESSKLKKVNGYLSWSQDRPILVISPELV